MKHAYAIILLGLVFGACQNRPAAKPELPTNRFNAQDVKWLSIIQSDPESAESHYQARVEIKDLPGKLKRAFLVEPKLSDQADSMAEETLVLHLLDTLSTLETNSEISEASRGQIDRSTHWKLTWLAHGPDGLDHTYTLILGPRYSLDANVYSRLARFDEASPRVFIVSGAALKMLEYVDSFEKIRKRTLGTWHLDDIDRAIFRSPGNKAVKIERNGKHWDERQEVLEALTHLRIKRFIDDEIEATTKTPTHATPLDTWATSWQNRQGEWVELKIRREQGRLIGSFSDRNPRSSFELYPETAKILAQWPRP